MKPYGALSSNKSESNRKYAVKDLTIIKSESEEAFVAESAEINTLST